MKAKREYSVNNERHALQDVIPLKTPYAVFLDVCDVCNFKCNFCAVQNDKKKRSFMRGIMSYELFKKCVDDLSEFPDKLKVLRVTGLGEPLLNRHFPQMVKYAKMNGCAEMIESVSNGSLLTHKLSEEIVDAGLDKIRFSIEGTNKEDYKIIGCHIENWDSFIENFQYLYSIKKQLSIYMKVVDASVDTEEKQKVFFDTFGNCCDKINIEHISPVWAGFEEINDRFNIGHLGVHGEKIKEVNICPDPFYSMIIHCDGTVGICCSDWERIEIIGDVNKEKLIDIWMGPRHRRLLESMLEKGRRKCSKACNKCEYPNYRMIDNIDPFAGQILENMRKRLGKD